MTSRISAVTMPKWGMTMTEGKVTRWLVAEGGTVRPGMDVVEIETTKITNVLEGVAEGVVRRLVVSEGTSAAVGSVIAIVAAPDVTDAEIATFLSEHAASTDDDGDDSAAGPASRLLAAGPHTLNVLSLGSGSATPVIFLHGFGGDLNSWLFNQPAIAGSQPTHALDLPGHGQSSASYGKGSARALSESVIALMDALAIPRAHLVGQSMGGAIALLLAIGHANRVASVTGVAPGGLGPELNRAFIDGFIAADRRKSMQDALGLLFARPDAVSRTMVDESLGFKRQDGVTEGLKTIAAANFTPDGQKSGLRELLSAIKVPVQIIWGREDLVIPVAQAANLPPAIAVTVLDGAGHMPHMEKSADANRLIADFIGLHG